jgi:hypothetical protein
VNIEDVGDVAFDGSGDATVASAEEALDSSEGWRRRTFCGWASIYVEMVEHNEDVGGGYGDSQCRATDKDESKHKSARITRPNAGGLGRFKGTHYYVHNSLDNVFGLVYRRLF